MSILDKEIRNLVIANRILAHEGIFDALGHVSIRNPENPKSFFMARSRSPELVEEGDVLEYTLDAVPVHPTECTHYIERPIHGAVYAARPDVMAVVHNHSNAVLPFTITGIPLRPVTLTAARIGENVPVWDIGDRFGDTDLLVTTADQGEDLATCLAGNRVVLMRGHGATVAGHTLEDAVLTSIYLEINARLQIDAMRLGEVKYLTPGEIEMRLSGTEKFVGYARAWEYYSRRSGR